MLTIARRAIQAILIPACALLAGGCAPVSAGVSPELIAIQNRAAIENLMADYYPDAPPPSRFHMQMANLSVKVHGATAHAKLFRSSVQVCRQG